MEKSLSFLENGQIDVLVSLYKTAEREQHFLFTDAYYFNPVAIFVNQDNDANINEWSALTTVTGVSLIGESFGDKFDRYVASSLDIARVNTLNQAFSMLEKRRVDYVVYSRLPALMAIDKMGSSHKFKPLALTISTQAVHMAISRKSSLSTQLATINRKIEAMVSTGMIESIVAQHIAKQGP